MEELLTPVRTSYKKPDERSEDLLTEIQRPAKAVIKSSSVTKATNPSEALEILQNEPDYETLIDTLTFLLTDSADFSLNFPSPLAAQLINVLVSETIPTYWIVLKDGTKARRKVGAKKFSDFQLLLLCLKNVAGLNAILLSMKQQIQNSKQSKKVVGDSNTKIMLLNLLQVLSRVLLGEHSVKDLSSSIWGGAENSFKQQATWNELASIIAGGKILGMSAEAETVLNDLDEKIGEKFWIADGALYNIWLARNISQWARVIQDADEQEWKLCAELLSRSFRLGHKEILVKTALENLLLLSESRPTSFEKLLNGLPTYDQKTFVLTSLKYISKVYLSSDVTSEDDPDWWQADAEYVSASAGLIKLILGDGEVRKGYLIAWLTSSSGAGVGDGIAIRRAALVALATEKIDIETILEKTIEQFGDNLYIRHTPTMQQEVHAQVLLISAGYVHRKAPRQLTMKMRSGAHLSLVSNRLAAPSTRARFLGMIVGEALSSLVDKGDKVMDFKVDEMKTAEAKWYKSLVGVSDNVGSLGLLRSKGVTRTSRTSHKPQAETTAKSEILRGSSKIVSIEEIEDDDDEEGSDDEDLAAYAKPDSDVEDSDEDATLISRNKPTSPVYIRDLLAYLRDTESYDKQKIALQTAATLIRRKANFGTEVSSHVEELATLLVGLEDKYDIDDFLEMRSQGMIATLVAQPSRMGQWFSKTFFDGDYSISQRASVLITIGMGARELGGFGMEEASIKAESSFPSKLLPPNMHKIYGSRSPPTTTAIDNLSTALSNAMIAPMAASIADKATGPSIFKVRTFSSRMEVEKKRKKPIANALAKVVADGMFFPLTGRFFIHLKAYGSTRSNIVFEPYLLALFVKTLSILIHASGPSTMSLPQMTSEFWDLLLSLRTQSIGDITVVEALLFGFMTILEVNEEKRNLVEAHGRQLLETQEWIESVFGRINSGGSEEDDRVRMLAAGCLVRIREVVEKYQALLMGDLASFQS